MSGIEDRNRELNEGRAFEYVAGTLTADERRAFEADLQGNEELEREVRFWEEQLMATQDTQAEREPLPGNWDAIERRIQPQPSAHVGGLQSWIWKFSAAGFAAAWLLTIGLFFSSSNNDALNEPNADYVAVLTSQNGEALLTALTSTDGKQLWLKWDQTPASDEGSLQLWAQSRRDGQIRPLFVFNEYQHALTLDEAAYRLIRDSSYLLLTREEEGGSAIDEPSDILVAKGVCVRLQERSS